MKKGRLFVLSGPSGAGKGTICDKLVELDLADLSISMTTRNCRGKEIPDVSYYFVSQEEFQKTIDENGFLEWAEIYGNRYGTPKAPVLKKLEQGRDVILEIEMQGAMNVKRAYPDAVLIFVLPPSLSELKRRLRARGRDTEEQIEIRSRSVMDEIKKIYDYDNYIVNNDLDQAVNDAKKILSGEYTKITKQQADEVVRKFEEEI